MIILVYYTNVLRREEKRCNNINLHSSFLFSCVFYEDNNVVVGL